MERRSPVPGTIWRGTRDDSSPEKNATVETCSVVPPSTQELTPRKSSDTIDHTLSQTAGASSASEPYTVFISHAGEDKATIAFPLRKKLFDRGITAFVDEADMPPGTDASSAMMRAMETAKIGAIILSPEFVSRKWPMKEVMHFLKRREECSNQKNGGRDPPTIITCFYRLSIDDLYKEPRVNSNDPNDKLLYKKSRFSERQKNGEPEADVAKIKATLRALHGIMGVRNDNDANNDSSHLMSKRRDTLLDELCESICRSVPGGMGKHALTDSSLGMNRDSSEFDSFRIFFPPKLIGEKAVLDFESRDEQGNPITSEGKIKQYLLAEGGRPAGIVSVCGLGGVGKSTIVEVLRSDEYIRQRFVHGVHLIRLGSDASGSTLLECIYYILEVSGPEKKVQSLRERNNIEEVLDCFMARFEGKRCLFLIDDVWERSVNLRALSRLCDVVSVVGGNMVLITTREDNIASLRRDARIVPLDPREFRGEVARKMLFFHAAVEECDEVKADEENAISEILDMCAGLPLSLAVVGKNVGKLIRLDCRHAARVWSRYLPRLQASRQSLLRQNVASYGNLYATFAASLAFLDEKTSEERLGFKSKFSFAEMHRRLCVLQKQTAVPNTMLMHLWGTGNKENADSIAMVFVDFGLGGLEKSRNESEFETRFTVHDSVLDFAVWAAQRHSETGIVDAHNLLLEGYGSQHEGVSLETEDLKVGWWSRGIENDGYIHKQLCRHLVGGGRKKELCELLLTPLWVQRQIEVNGIMYLADDFGIGMNEITESEETKEALRLIRDAVILSSGFVMKNMWELWFQLHGRLKGYVQNNTMIEKYLKWVENDARKPRVLSSNRLLTGAGGRNVKVIAVRGGGVLCMSLFPDGERVACGCNDGSVVVVDIRRRDERNLVTSEDKFNSVSWIAVTQTGTRVLNKSWKENSLGLWDVESGNNVWTTGGHTVMDTPQNPRVVCCAITHDETNVVSVAKTGSLQFRDLNTGKVVAPAIDVGLGAEGISLLSDGERAIIKYRNGRLNLWNVRTAAKYGEYGDLVVSCFTVTRDERRVVGCSKDGRVTLWCLESRQQTWNSRIYGYIESVAVSDDGSRIALGCKDFEIQVLDVESKDQVLLRGHTDRVTRVSFLRNKNLIISSSWDGSVRVWDTVRGQYDTWSRRHRSRVTAVLFTPDGKFLVTGSWDRTLLIWDAKSGKTIGDPLEGHRKGVNDVAMAPDGGFAVSVSVDKKVRVWDFSSRTLLHTFEGHTDYVNCVAVTPKGDRAVTGSSDETVRVWDLRKMDGTHVVYKGHDCWVVRVFVSDDGLRVVSVDDEDHVFVWSLQTKEVMKTDVIGNARTMSRSELFSFIGEDTVHDDAGLSIPLGSKQITHGKGSGARVLATLESDIWSWDISPDKKIMCLGLHDGQVAVFNVDA